jgi:Short C-terminal domain
MAQFNHPEFAGSGQWMRGGMTMVSDMFNNYLKGRVDSLCSELSNLVANQPDLVRSGSFQSQSQGNGSGYGQAQTGYGSSQQQGGGYNGNSSSSSNGFGPSSLFVPPGPDWWGAELRFPNSTGAQNGVRYAYFAQARRLAIEVNGRVTVYDTLDHQIGGFSQQQSYGGTLSFNSQYGLIDVASLPVISVDGVAPYAPAAAPSPAPTQPVSNGASTNFNSPSSISSQDVFATIEKLADLRAKGILSDDEFASKKAELLSRV